jgi:hypothetical protein
MVAAGVGAAQGAQATVGAPAAPGGPPAAAPRLSDEDVKKILALDSNVEACKTEAPIDSIRRLLSDDGPMWQALAAPAGAARTQKSVDAAGTGKEPQTAAFRTAAGIIMWLKIRQSLINAVGTVKRDDLELEAGEQTLLELTTSAYSGADGRPRAEQLTNARLIEAAKRSLLAYRDLLCTKDVQDFLRTKFSELNRMIRQRCANALYGPATAGPAGAKMTVFAVRFISGERDTRQAWAQGAQPRVWVGREIRCKLLGDGAKHQWPTWTQLINDQTLLQVEHGTGKKVTQEGIAAPPVAAIFWGPVNETPTPAEKTAFEIRLEALCSLLASIRLSQEKCEGMTTNLQFLREMGMESTTQALVMAVLLRETYNDGAPAADAVDAEKSAKAQTEENFSFAARLHAWMEWKRPVMVHDVKIFTPLSLYTKDTQKKKRARTVHDENVMPAFGKMPDLD